MGSHVSKTVRDREKIRDARDLLGGGVPRITDQYPKSSPVGTRRDEIGLKPVTGVRAAAAHRISLSMLKGWSLCSS